MRQPDSVAPRPHLIESAQIWLERARLVTASRAIAAEENGAPFPKDDADPHRLFNLRTGRFLDYRSADGSGHPFSPATQT